MKLIVQIPCWNEQDTLPETVAGIPRQIAGVDHVELLVIDDGSSDQTVTAARAAGVDHIVRHTSHQGLAAAFRTGIDAALRLGADIIVNTDADNQYHGGDIPRLIAPILSGEADLVIGDRQVAGSPHFSRGKKLLERLGSFVVRVLSGTDVRDAVSGFRAISREAAFRVNVVSSFSYTIETIVQAGWQRMRVVSVPVHTNGKTRPSRLSASVPRFLIQSGATMLRSFAMYRPLRVFVWLGLALLALGAFPVARFLYLFAIGDGAGHIQSLVIGGVLVVLGGLSLMMAVLADLIAANRQLIELTLEKLRRLDGEHAAATALTNRFPQAGNGKVQHTDLEGRHDSGSAEHIGAAASDRIAPRI